MAEFDVVVPTFERPGALVRCLTALTQQSHPPHLVIVVDDCSVTPAIERLPTFLQQSLPLKVIRARRNAGPARSRNVGVGASDAEYLLFIDDDVVADRNLIARHALGHAAAGQRSAVIGPLKAPIDWRPAPWNRWEASTLNVEYEKMARGDYAPTWRQFFTGNASVRREDFQRAGGFDERFRRAEDIEFAFRLELKAGCHFIFDPSAIGWHYAERSRESWLSIARDYARFDVTMNALYPGLRWMRIVERDLQRRHPLTRAAGAMLRRSHLETQGTATALRAATSLDTIGSRRASAALLSLAYSIEYTASLRKARDELGGPLPPPESDTDDVA